MSGVVDCRHARLNIGAAPHALPADVAAHVATCTDCSRYREETLMLDGRVRAALEMPLAAFRTPAAAPAGAAQAPRVRRYALAASIALGVFLAAGFWLLKPQPALAGELVEHVRHEAFSWDIKEPMAPADVAGVLRTAGVEFDAGMPILYAAPCPFRGRAIAHLVVQTANGPMTVMLLPHETVKKRGEFSEDGMRGVILPAGAGSVAVLARGADVPAGMADEIVSSVRW
jgi:hypothetical protein